MAGEDKRVYVVSMGLIATVLAAFVVYDIYSDWFVEGFGPRAALFENAVPLAFVAALLYATAWLAVSGDRYHATTMTKWAVLGVGGFVLITGWVTAIQLLEQDFQPLVVLVHTAIGGAVAGTLLGYVVAERDRSRARLQYDKRRFEALFENDPAGIVDLRLEDGPIIRRTNPSFLAAFDLDDDSLDGRRLFDVLSLPPATRNAVRDHIESGEVYEADQSVEHDDRYYHLRVAPYGTDNTRAYAIFDDVTELERTRRDLQRNVAQLEKSNERLQQFAYIASHDLQEPLRMVASYMRLLEDEYREDLDEEAREYINFAVDGAERMQNMVNGLLEYSRVRTQGEAFSEVDANDVLAEALRSLDLHIEETNATVTSDSLPTVEADRRQLGQLFQNLVDNAITHGGDDIDVHVSCTERDGEYVFSVADDGVGIPESQQEKVFELFKQGSREGDGTGIGLAICDRIVSRHDGEMWLESEEGEGTTFYFSMPK